MFTSKNRIMKEFVKFHVIGKDTRGKRFKLVYSSPSMAFGINLWSGNVWGIRENGTKKLLKSF